MTNSSLRCSLTIIACLVITLLFPLHAHAQAGERVAVGSKQFTESVVLGEIVRTLAERMDVPARHQAGLGGTGVVFQSLIAGEIDVYVEYTGTLTREILAGESAESSQAIRTALAQRSLAMTEPLGFNNTYAIGMREDRARELNIRSISDLADHPALRLGFNSEFLDRGDGWPSLREAYSLPHRDVRGMDHSLAYQALAAGQIDVMEFYSTDADSGGTPAPSSEASCRTAR